MKSPSPIERNIEIMLENSFPQYLIFREIYLIPLRGLPYNPNWRIDTHPLLEQIGVTAYGILKSLNFIEYRKNKVTISDFDQSFKNIYFHFGLIFDCVEFLCRKIVLIEKELGLSKFESKVKQSKEKLLEYFNNWIDKEYEQRFKQMIEQGKPILCYPHGDINYLSQIIQNPLKRNYNTFSKGIKDYRNFFIHNPGVDIFIDTRSKKLYTVKKEFVYKSKNWANLQLIFEYDKDQFVDPILIINSDIDQLLDLLNQIWEKMNLRMENIYNHSKFELFFKNYRREFPELKS